MEVGEYYNGLHDRFASFLNGPRCDFGNSGPSDAIGSFSADPHYLVAGYIGASFY